ncbi:hypothetical protein L226DRAFT_569862 [Lentinus tigrinus ALCF2SS1-7]|uniref:F-box domain-containing protein n=1 Tax=Lentinus tigrinus ALCF2SS1-6 TaxID=1328759 RepID=A0A5C2SKN9_9APHY|nr:hypothetical protein L227DRAFT_608086 [Lentinus tigrinus ALCF2SS1-6]RPD76625.1 hypothetical protein L226DRAFT_569862 [Lentinus tigrinus ALCF2SS1-7]
MSLTNMSCYHQERFDDPDCKSVATGGPHAQDNIAIAIHELSEAPYGHVADPPKLSQSVFTLTPFDVIAVILEFSDFRLLAAWRTTCRVCYNMVTRYLRRRYQTLVGRFVPNVSLFDALLRRHGAIVSGSVALRFFLPFATWEPNDLDVYVPYTQFRPFVRAITDAAGLNFTLIAPEDSTASAPIHDDAPTPAAGPPAAGAVEVDQPAPGDEAVHHGDNDIAAASDDAVEATTPPEEHHPSSPTGFHHVEQFSTPSGNHVRVDVITALSDNPVYCLQRFWSQLVMNFLRSDACVCGFPLETLQGYGNYKSPITPRNGVALDKYRSRGFHLEPRTHGELNDNPNPASFGGPTPLVWPLTAGLRTSDLHLPIQPTIDGWITSSSWAAATREHSLIPPPNTLHADNLFDLPLIRVVLCNVAPDESFYHNTFE